MKIRHFLNGLAAVALVGAGPARADWMEARSEHLVIDIDADEAVARDYAIKLERFDAALRLLYGVADDPTRRVNPVHIYPLKEGLFESVCDCVGWVGFQSPSATGSAIFTIYKAKLDEKSKQGDQTPQAVLLHEYSHQFMYSSFPLAYPLWYSEGFAEFNANAAFETNGAVDIGFPANYRAWSIRNQYEELTVREFFEPPESYPVDTLYGRGWLMTHYLTLDPARKGQLATYLAEFNKGKSSLDAAQIAFGDVNRLYRDLFDYRTRKGGLAKPLRIPPAKYAPAVSVVPLSPGAAAMMPYHIRIAWGLSSKRAKDMVKEASRIAGAYPRDARAQVDLAGIAFIADDLDTADAAAYRALSADPGNRNALLRKGQIAVRRVSQASAATPTDWAAARAWYLKANKAEPDASLPLLLYYQSFVTAKQVPSKGAVLGLKRAEVLTPEDGQIRMLLARRLIDEGDAKGARYLLQPVAFSPHAREDDNAARKVIGLIDAGNLADAGKAMDDAIADDAKKKK
jgi:hypothetical protein